jgi:hypothetical protein
VVTWPEPELDAGADPGDCSPLELGELPPDELPDPADGPAEAELPELPERPELLDLLEPLEPLAVAELPDGPVLAGVAWLAAWAPGSSSAIPPTAIRLAAVAETATARSRVFPRSLVSGDDAFCWPWLMPGSLTNRSRRALWESSHAAMNVHYRPSSAG